MRGLPRCAQQAPSEERNRENSAALVCSVRAFLRRPGARYPGFEVVGWFGAFAAVGTPRPIIAKVAAEMTRAVRSPDVVARLVELGTKPAGGTPEEFMANWKATADQLGDIIRRAKITVE